MGKNKSSKKQLKKFLKGNRVLVAALTGVATGITIAGILGTERAKQLVNTVEDSLRDFGSRIKEQPSRPARRSKEETDKLSVQTDQ